MNLVFEYFNNLQNTSKFKLAYKLGDVDTWSDEYTILYKLTYGVNPYEINFLKILKEDHQYDYFIKK